MYSRAARLARGWVVGAFATALAALSHALAGGGVPSALALLGGVVFAGLLGTLAAGRTPSLPRLAVAVLGSQLAFHVGFSYLGSAVSTPPASTPAVTTGTMLMSHGEMDVVVASSAHHHVDSPAMWIAHAVAAFVTLVFLRFAERAVWSLLTQLVGLVVSPFRAARPLPVRATRPAPLPVSSPSLFVGRLLGAAVSRRGPPLSVAF
ncbi:hypothetical protein BH11ACT3_BH11ACT3_15220 [soil metagenome]